MFWSLKTDLIFSSIEPKIDRLSIYLSIYLSIVTAISKKNNTYIESIFSPTKKDC